MENLQHKFKILILGESSVGKSSIVKKYTDDNNYTPIIKNNKKNEEQIILPTIGIDYKLKVIEKYNLSLQIFDTSGQEKFRALVNSYYRGTHAIIFVFSLNNIDSLNELDEFWIPDTKNHYTEEQPYYILIGNKSELEYDKSILHKIKFIKEKYDLEYFEISCYNNCNIEKPFNNIIDNLRTLNKTNNYLMVNIDNNNIKYKPPLNNRYYNYNNDTVKLLPNKKYKYNSCC